MDTIFHAVAGYFFLLLIVRVLSRRPGGQLTLFEFVIVFLIGGIVILSTMTDDRSMTNSTCGVIAIALLHRVVAKLKSKFPRLGAIVDGTPLVLLNNGRWQKDVMSKMRVDDRDVMAAARSKGIQTLAGIKFAILERNGSISIIKAQN